MNLYGLEMPLPSFLEDDSRMVDHFKDKIYLLEKKWIVTLGWLRFRIDQLGHSFDIGVWCKYDYIAVNRFLKAYPKTQNTPKGYLMTDLPFYKVGCGEEVKIVYNDNRFDFQEPDLYISNTVDEVFQDQKHGLSHDKYLRWMDWVQNRKLDLIYPNAL